MHKFKILVYFKISLIEKWAIREDGYAMHSVGQVVKLISTKVHMLHIFINIWPFPELRFYGNNREDFVFIRPPGVEASVLAPENVWYCRVRLLFDMSVKVDTARTRLK